MKKRFRYFFISISSIIITLIAVFFIQIILGNNTNTTIEEDTSYSPEEVEELVEEAKEEGKVSVLTQIRNALESGNTVISTLKLLYPEQLVIVSSNKYNWVDINDDLAKNSYDIDNLQVDDNGIYSYVVDGEVKSKKGIDVSSHQGDIDWPKVAADGVEFVFVRALYRGYGTGQLVVDDKCLDNIAGAQAAGIDVGVYVFSQAINEEEVIEEAQSVLELLKGYSLELPIVFDVEKISGSDARMNSISVDERTNIALTFLNEIESNGYSTMVYHNTEMGGLLLDFSQLEAYDKWFAGYNFEFYWPYDYKIWQYSESGTVDGINGAVDLDIWFLE